MNSAANDGLNGTYERTMREMIEALLVSSVHQHEIIEQAERIEAALRKSEGALRLQAEELSRFNRLAVGREVRMIELKKEVNDLARRQGESARYPLQFEPADLPRSAGAASATENAASHARANGGTVPLAAVLCTEELTRRPPRPPDYETENSALVSLVRALADSPGDVLQILAEKILEVLKSDSAGLSLLTPDGTRFYWPAIAGMWNPYIGGGTPRDFGPCGDVLDRNAPLLFHHFERRYTYFLSVTPPAQETLLVPFYVEDKAVGTVWAIAHGDQHFDAEDRRQLESLARFASAAYQATEFRAFEQARREAALNLMEDVVQSREAMEKVNADLRVLEKKTQEQALSLADLNRRKDEFLAMLSHELRNPLASIRTATHLLRLQRDPTPMQEEAQGIIERQVMQLVRLIDDLLDVSRISTGLIRLRLERVDFRDIIHRAIETTQQQIDQKGQSLAASLPDGPQWLQGDPVRLEQVVVNLVNNASKYTDCGGHIGVALHTQRDEVVLRVSDTGIGIAPEMLLRIFDLFTQADHSLDRSQGGLGIGLAIVKSIVTLHGGRVEARSTQGQGSEFLVAIPLLSSSDAVAAVPAENGVAPIDVLKVLVVDDNADAARSIALVLQAMGHDVRLAYDGANALKAAHEFTPDVVVLDIGLPIVDGFEVAKRIREVPALKDVMLIALTGYAQDSGRQRAHEAGFNHHLVKPVDIAELQRILAGVAVNGDA